jgi:pimeloyl-ACP methyl ester carboxylesterase
MSGIFIDGSLIHYEIFGRGKPIIFVHGWLGSWRYWVPVMDDLARDHRTYALDLWGFGDSDKTRELYEIDAYVDLLISFMDELGIMRAPLVTHTLGAAIAVRLASCYPDRVSRVLAASLPLSADAINRKLLTAGPNEALARLFWHRQRPYPEVEMGLAKAAENAIALSIQSVAQLNLRTILDEVDAPLLTVYGERDTVIDPAQADEMEEDIYAARAIVLEKAAHFSMLDQTAKFVRLLRDFMDINTPDELQQLAVKEEWRRRTR